MRRAPRGKKNLVRFNHAAVGERGTQLAIHFVNSCDLRLEPKIDLTLAHFLGQGRANVVVEAAQKKLAAMELRRMRAEAMKYAGKFDADITAPDDDNLLR